MSDLGEPESDEYNMSENDIFDGNNPNRADPMDLLGKLNLGEYDEGQNDDQNGKNDSNSPSMHSEDSDNNFLNNIQASENSYDKGDNKIESDEGEKVDYPQMEQEISNYENNQYSQEYDQENNQNELDLAKYMNNSSENHQSDNNDNNTNIDAVNGVIGETGDYGSDKQNSENDGNINENDIPLGASTMRRNNLLARMLANMNPEEEEKQEEQANQEKYSDKKEEEENTNDEDAFNETLPHKEERENFTSTFGKSGTMNFSSTMGVGDFIDDEGDYGNEEGNNDDFNDSSSFKDDMEMTNDLNNEEEVVQQNEENNDEEPNIYQRNIDYNDEERKNDEEQVPEEQATEDKPEIPNEEALQQCERINNDEVNQQNEEITNKEEEQENENVAQEQGGYGLFGLLNNVVSNLVEQEEQNEKHHEQEEVESKKEEVSDAPEENDPIQQENMINNKPEEESRERQIESRDIPNEEGEQNKQEVPNEENIITSDHGITPEQLENQTFKTQTKEIESPQKTSSSSSSSSRKASSEEEIGTLQQKLLSLNALTGLQPVLDPLPPPPQEENAESSDDDDRKSTVSYRSEISTQTIVKATDRIFQTENEPDQIQSPKDQPVLSKSSPKKKPMPLIVRPGKKSDTQVRPISTDRSINNNNSQSEEEPHPKKGSIDAFNPVHPRPLRERYSIQACNNLGISFDELCYPTEKDIYAYTRDPELHDLVRDEIMARVDRTIDRVKRERRRLIDKEYEMQNRIVSRSAPVQSAQPENQQDFVELERARIKRLEMRNRKEAEQVIYTILVEKELAAEEQERMDREYQEKLKYEQELREKHQKEREAQQKRIKEIEEKERLKKIEDERKRQEELEKEMKFEEWKAKQEAERKKRFEEIEKDRIKKNEKSKQIALEAEQSKQKAFLEQKKMIEEREKQMAAKKAQQQKALEKKNREFERKKQEQIQRILTQHKRILEDKRARTENKARTQEENYARQLEEKNKILEETRLKEQEKLMKGEQYRQEYELRRSRETKEKVETKLNKAEENLIHLQEEQESIRKREAIKLQFRKEERYRESYRIAKMKEALAAESTVMYELRLKSIEEMEEQKRRQHEEAELTRFALEKERNKILEGGITPKEIRKKNPRQLKLLAKKLDIDYDSITEKAKKARRGRRTDLAQTLPPISGSNSSRRQNESRPHSRNSNDEPIQHLMMPGTDL